MTLHPGFVAGYLTLFAVAAVAVAAIVKLEVAGIRRPGHGDTITDMWRAARHGRPWVAWVTAAAIMLAVGFAVIGGGWLFGHWILDAW